MKMNQIGTSNLYVSPFTLGCMSIGTDEKKATAMIHRALDAGINHLDTADLYDFGMNEKIIGNAIKGRRDNIVITTKVGNHFDVNEKTWYWDPSPSYLKDAVRKSLKRLQTDYIDLLLFHGGTIQDPIDDIIETAEKLIQSGIIRAYGISSIRPNVIDAYVERANMDAVMMQYNMLDRRPEQLLSYLHQNDISVLARGPLAKGILSSEAIQQMNTKAPDGYLEYDKEGLQKTVNMLTQMNMPLESLAFSYILFHPAVATAVFGASSLTQLEENISHFPTTALQEQVYTYILKHTKFFQYEAHQIK